MKFRIPLSIIPREGSLSALTKAENTLSQINVKS